MSKLSNGAKQGIIEEVLSGNGVSIRSIAKKYNIGVSTLHKWIKKYREDDIIEGKKPEKTTSCLSDAKRFEHLIVTASMSEEEIGAYCRENGLYSFQLTAWKESFMSPKTEDKNQSLIAEVKALRTENKKLKQDIKRKDAALSEASALLILKKKASMIWGEIEGD